MTSKPFLKLKHTPWRGASCASATLLGSAWWDQTLWPLSSCRPVSGCSRSSRWRGICLGLNPYLRRLSESLGPLRHTHTHTRDGTFSNTAENVAKVTLPSRSCTDLAAGVPQRHRVVVGWVGPGTGRIDAAQLVHIMIDEGVCCMERTTAENGIFLLFLGLPLWHERLQNAMRSRQRHNVSGCRF